MTHLNTTPRWALRRGPDWICAPDGPGHPLPPCITLGPGTPREPVLTLSSYDQARNVAWLLRSIHGLTAEPRKLP